MVRPTNHVAATSQVAAKYIPVTYTPNRQLEHTHHVAQTNQIAVNTYLYGSVVRAGGKHLVIGRDSNGVDVLFVGLLSEACVQFGRGVALVL